MLWSEGEGTTPELKRLLLKYGIPQSQVSQPLLYKWGRIEAYVSVWGGSLSIQSELPWCRGHERRQMGEQSEELEIK